MKTQRHLIALSLAFSIAGCTFIARDAETYRADTRSVVETRNDTIKECYDAALEADEKAAGTVVVNFIVEKKTGTIAKQRGRVLHRPRGSLAVHRGERGLSLEPGRAKARPPSPGTRGGRAQVRLLNPRRGDALQ